MGSDLPVEHGPERGVNGVVRRLADTAAAERDLGFAAEVGLEEGLRAARRVVASAARRDRCRTRADGSVGMSVVDESLTRINVMQPWLGEEEVAAVAEVLRSGWVAQGPRVAEFESAFAESQQVPHAVAVSNCTTALHLALVVAGVGPGDEVVVPSFSFVATANAPTYVGATPGLRRRRRRRRATSRPPRSPRRSPRARAR